jgi:hypothetical protein
MDSTHRDQKALEPTKFVISNLTHMLGGTKRYQNMINNVATIILGSCHQTWEILLRNGLIHTKLPLRIIAAR